MFLVRSGIPALDSMFHPRDPSPNDTERDEQNGIYLSNTDDTTSLCITGPDGTGKSVLAMHYASRYLADAHHLCRKKSIPRPLAFYVSSDLSFLRADDMWQNFGLDQPNARKIPFKYPQMSGTPAPPWLGGGTYEPEQLLALAPYEPEAPDKIAEYLLSQGTGAVAFLDFASHTAGDDWGFMERLLAAMQAPPAGAPRHLLVIDAMEGMETFAGELDGFGQKTTRRGRVAKLMRLAALKCHLVFVIEEPEEGSRLAEQFVADVVLRLRATEQQGYSRRTVEVEKARGQSHVRGRHPYVIRDGRGSTTGEQPNADDPRVYRDESRGVHQSYLDVFPSLHSISRMIMQNRGSGRDQRSGRRAGFGIKALDEMLAIAQEDVQPTPHGQNDHGLPCGTVSAVIGDANTQKSFLALAFLGHVFHQLAWTITSNRHAEIAEKKDDPSWADENCGQNGNPARAHYVRQLCAVFARRRAEDQLGPRHLTAEVRRWAAVFEKHGGGAAGAIVLITTKDENNRTLVDRFRDQLKEETRRRAKQETAEIQQRVAEVWADPAFEVACTAYLESRTICRRLGIHDIPPPVLFHTIQRSVEAAHQIIAHDYFDVCTGKPLSRGADKRAAAGWRVRFVIDDLNSIMRTYGKVHDDPLFLPFLLRSLRREGLSALIVETQAGKHGSLPVGFAEEAQSDLRALSDYRIYTWHVPDFFGDHRIAIAAIPPMVQLQDRKSPVLVRELEWYEPNSKTTPRVDPRFELYAGLDTDKPRLVPLQVHLYAETPAWAAYIASLDDLWQRVFDPPPALPGEKRLPVVVAEQPDSYEAMRDACALRADTNLDYSLIVQIDEFWHHRDAFRSQFDYLTRLVDSDLASGSAAPAERISWFEDAGYRLPSPQREGPTSGNSIRNAEAEASRYGRLDRVPFVWDFGFLACREDLWMDATSRAAPDHAMKATNVWNQLKANQPGSWAEVFEGAAYVAKSESVRLARKVPAFDFAMVAPEAFSCLVLEIWFSEICERNARWGETIVNVMRARHWDDLPEALDLATLVRDCWKELYCTWLLLVEVLDLDAYASREAGFGFAFGRLSDPNAVLTRHWYKTAAFIDAPDKASTPRFCRLPGSFSVRGDWFLAAVRGSRSDRLVDRALDLLSTTDGNVDRLLRGIGLPTRRLGAQPDKLSSRMRGRHHDRPRDEPGTLTYKQVLSLGPQFDENRTFHWLWRSNIRRYYAVAPIWERWLYRVLRRWKRTREHLANEWVSGFTLYDKVRQGEDIRPVVSYDDFQRMRDVLLSDLSLIPVQRSKL